jgi:hypothetical protein
MVERIRQLEATIELAKEQILRLEEEIRTWQQTLNLAELELWSEKQQESKAEGIRERSRSPGSL